MNLQMTRRRLAPLGAASALLWALSLPSYAPAADTMLFCGAGFGPTVEVAVQAAIEDAEVSASGSQLFTCELVGEPEIFPGPNPEWGRNFTAQVTMECGP